MFLHPLYVYFQGNVACPEISFSHNHSKIHMTVVVINPLKCIPVSCTLFAVMTGPLNSPTPHTSSAVHITSQPQGADVQTQIAGESCGMKTHNIDTARTNVVGSHTHFHSSAGAASICTDVCKHALQFPNQNQKALRKDILYCNHTRFGSTKIRSGINMH